MPQPATILIVDDIPENVDILDGILKEEYRIKVAVHGKGALKVSTSADPPDLILLDIMMPDMDGYEVLRRLKADPKTAGIPVIFITAKSETEDETTGFGLGAVDYIQKPIRPEIVKARVRTHLELKFARDILEKQNTQLKSALQFREELSNMIIHDMRIPLCSIAAFSELLLMKPEMAAYQEQIRPLQQSARQLNSLINDILILAKTEATQLVLHRSLVDMAQLLHQSINIHSSVAKLKGIAIAIEKPPQKLPPVSVDVKLLARVLDNLLANALKFSPTGTVITARLEYLGNEAARKFRIQICDQGSGIPGAQRANIFEKFSTVETRNKGILQIGLGLAFSRMVVEAHGGIIAVSDHEPHGTVMTVEM